MTKLFRHFLLLGAIFGLLWQGVAIASPPCADMQQQSEASSVIGGAMAGMADCMDAEKQSHEGMPPCKDMKAGCFAMVGCASLVALDVLPVGVTAPQQAALRVSWATSPVLVGRTEAPIPDPPSRLS